MAVQVNPFVIKRADFLRLLGSPLIGRRVLYAADHGLPPWCDLLKTIRRGGRGSERLLDFESARACYEKILFGQMPPLMPCEVAGLGQNRGSDSFAKSGKERSTSRLRRARRRRADSPRATLKSQKGGVVRGETARNPKLHSP